VSGVATGRHTRANNCRSGATLSRDLAFQIAAVLGTTHDVRQCRAPCKPAVSSRATSSLPGKQAHCQHEVDHQPGRQQPVPLLHPTHLRQHLVHKRLRKRLCQHPDRDPVRQQLTR